MALTLAEKITHAESEYHDLMVGDKPSVIVDQNGERVEFTRANAASLKAYIEELKRQQAGSDSGTGPMRFTF